MSIQKDYKIKVRKGDIVTILSGEWKGKQGKILSVEPETKKAIVEGINMASRHTKANAKNPQGGIIKQESPIHLAKLMLVDPKSGKPTRVGRRIEDGKLVRFAKKSGETIKENK
jgi:large subunit ribosomal protein L24